MSEPLEQPLPEGIEDQSDERVNWRRVMWTAAASLAIFFLGALAATWMLYDVTGRIEDDPTVAEKKIGVEQVGMVETRIIATEDRALKLARERNAQLQEYGWVDREKQLIRVPIERGMQWVIEGRR